MIQFEEFLKTILANEDDHIITISLNSLESNFLGRMTVEERTQLAEAKRIHDMKVYIDKQVSEWKKKSTF